MNRGLNQEKSATVQFDCVYDTHYTLSLELLDLQVTSQTFG